MKLLICDDDVAYVEALVKHFISENPTHYEIRAYSTLDGLMHDRGTYDVGILGEQYLEAYEKDDLEDVQIAHPLLLRAQEGEDREGVESIYKYQSMRSFKSQLAKTVGRGNVGMSQAREHGESRVIGVFSPMHHELQLPFALCLSDWCGQREPVLFVNMEALSVQPALMDVEGRRDLLDLLYVVANRKETKVNLAEYICESEGISYIPPMNSPTEVAYITGEQWMSCGQKIRENFRGTIVLLLDYMMQGFEQVLSDCDGLILLTKPGEYYRKSMQAFRNRFLEERKFRCWMQQVSLPMSAGATMEETYDLGQMLRSKMAQEIRKELQHVPYLA